LEVEWIMSKSGDRNIWGTGDKRRPLSEIYDPKGQAKPRSRKSSELGIVKHFIGLPDQGPKGKIAKTNKTMAVGSRTMGEAFAGDRPGELIGRLMKAGSRMAESGFMLGSYFSHIGEDNIATQRTTKDKIGSRLRAADEKVQIVTVQGRNGEPAAIYGIVDLAVLTAAVEAVVEEPPFVPITAMMRQIGGDVDFAAFKPVKSGRRMRSATFSRPSNDKV